MPGHKKGAKLVRWNQEEVELVANQAARLRVENLMGELEAFRQAQLVLPDHRRRKLTGLTNLVPAHMELFHERVDALRRERDEAELRAAAPLPQPEPQQQPSAVGPLPLDTALELLLTVVAQKIGLVIKQQLAQAITELLPPELVPAQIERTVSKPHSTPKARLLIVGLLPAQQELVRQRYSKHLDMRFVSSQETPQQITARVGDVDKVLLMTNFINHSHQNTAIQLKGREHVLPVAGGMSSLYKALDSIAQPN